MDDIALNTDFDLNKMIFLPVEGAGFMFGNEPQKLFFVPCYSEQNGWYSRDIEVYFNGEKVLEFECEEKID